MQPVVTLNTAFQNICQDTASLITIGLSMQIRQIARQMRLPHMVIGRAICVSLARTLTDLASHNEALQLSSK